MLQPSVRTISSLDALTAWANCGHSHQSSDSSGSSNSFLSLGRSGVADSSTTRRANFQHVPSAYAGEDSASHPSNAARDQRPQPQRHADEENKDASKSVFTIVDALEMDGAALLLLKPTACLVGSEAGARSHPNAEKGDAGQCHAAAVTRRHLLDLMHMACRFGEVEGVEETGAAAGMVTTSEADMGHDFGHPVAYTHVQRAAADGVGCVTSKMVSGQQPGEKAGRNPLQSLFQGSHPATAATARAATAACCCSLLHVHCALPPNSTLFHGLPITLAPMGEASRHTTAMEAGTPGNTYTASVAATADASFALHSGERYPEEATYPGSTSLMGALPSRAVLMAPCFQRKYRKPGVATLNPKSLTPPAPPPTPLPPWAGQFVYEGFATSAGFYVFVKGIPRLAWTTNPNRTMQLQCIFGEGSSALHLPAVAASQEVVLCPHPPSGKQEAAPAMSAWAGASSAKHEGVRIRVLVGEIEGVSVVTYRRKEEGEADHRRSQVRRAIGSYHEEEEMRRHLSLSNGGWDTPGDSQPLSEAALSKAPGAASARLLDDRGPQENAQQRLQERQQRQRWQENQRAKPYRLCACTMVYDAARFLREWVVYHQWMGVQRFFLYDNNSDDDTPDVVDNLALGEGRWEGDDLQPVGRNPREWVEEEEEHGEEGVVRRKYRTGGGVRGNRRVPSGRRSLRATEDGFRGRQPSSYASARLREDREEHISRSQPLGYVKGARGNRSDPEARTHVWGDGGGGVTLHPWPWYKTQQAGFSHCLLRAKPLCDWVMFADVDEFVVPKHAMGRLMSARAIAEAKKVRGPFLHRLLSAAEEGEFLFAESGRGKGRRGRDGRDGEAGDGREHTSSEDVRSAQDPENAEGRRAAVEEELGPGRRENLQGDDSDLPLGQVSFPCLNFGPSGQKQHPAGGVTAGYTCRDRRIDRHKSFVRPDAVAAHLTSKVHHFELAPGWRHAYLMNRDRPAVFNHYKFQAWSEFRRKFERRVGTYVRDWGRLEGGTGGRDKPVEVTAATVEPEGWTASHCQMEDRYLEAFVRVAFGVRNEDGQTVMAWEM